MAAVLIAGLAHPASTGAASSESEAKAAARQFMRTLNAKRFEQVCHMMSARFYRENNVPDEARCVLGLRIGFMGTEGRAVVQALANGALGRIVLVEEHGVFKVLSVRGT
jgi:hypothetical protein